MKLPRITLQNIHSFDLVNEGESHSPDSSDCLKWGYSSERLQCSGHPESSLPPPFASKVTRSRQRHRTRQKMHIKNKNTKVKGVVVAGMLGIRTYWPVYGLS